MPSTIYIDVPENFSFRATVYSHGWCELAPFSLDTENWRLSYVFSDGKSVVPAVICEEKNKLRIDLASSKIKPEKIVRDTRHILRLDDDLSGLYAAVADNERLAWIAHRRAGRLLRSPTVWEDLVKTICTTNCSWALTKIMVNNLVDKLGADAGKGKHAFPVPQEMALQDEQFYRIEIKAGYRAPYFIELAEKVASGELNPESWLNSDLPTAELKKEMKKVKGVGDYAAENLLKLVGRYDGLALDSWLRSQFYKNHNNGRACKDIKIERHYKKYGEWRGLVIWCDMTEKWIT
jgi:3-methyladenine DNA glycosylase/8-oxoguanine DNA glycosylase